MTTGRINQVCALPTVAMPEQAVLPKVSSGKQEQQAIQRNMLNHKKCLNELLIKSHSEAKASKQV
jgi:hypothetical protein